MLTEAVAPRIVVVDSNGVTRAERGVSKCEMKTNLPSHEIYAEATQGFRRDR